MEIDRSCLNEPVIGIVWGGVFLYIYWWKMIAYIAQFIKMLSLTNFRSPLHGESLTLYSSARTILTLHLLIIWVIIWVLVPSDTPSGLLWVGVAKVTLFRSFLHINAAKVLVGVHLIRRQQFFLKLLYHHALVCLPVVLIFFFGRLWEAASVVKYLFSYLGLGWPRTKSFSVGFLGCHDLSFPPYAIMGPSLGLRPSMRGGCRLLGLTSPHFEW